jgi:RND family efflux transporter MFP subunit
MNKLSCLLIPLAAATSACDTQSAEGVPQAKPIKNDAPPALEMVEVEAKKLDTSVRLPGEIGAYEVVALHPRVSAFVEEVLVDRGSHVKRGQLLSRLSAPELLAQRAEAESKLIGSKSTYQRLKAASETPGVVATHDVEIAQAAVKADEARVDALKTLESYLFVRAPFDGVITERNVHPGALVGPTSGGAGVPMLRMQSVEHLRLVVPVPEQDVGAIAQGATAEFTVRTWPQERFSGTITRISGAIDPKTRTMPVELDVDNKAGRLAPGMFPEVIWPVRRPGPSLLVPATAIAQTTERTFVDRVRDGVIEQVVVERGATLGDKVEVFGALEAGDRVLRRGSEELKPGTKVTAKEATPQPGAPK